MRIRIHIKFIGRIRIRINLLVESRIRIWDPQHWKKEKMFSVVVWETTLKID
jgi:hypothetical protein